MSCLWNEEVQYSSVTDQTSRNFSLRVMALVINKRIKCLVKVHFRYISCLLFKYVHKLYELINIYYINVYVYTSHRLHIPSKIISCNYLFSRNLFIDIVRNLTIKSSSDWMIVNDVPCSMELWSRRLKKKFKGRLVGPFQHCIRRLIVLLPPNEFLHSSPEAPRNIQARETSAKEGRNYYQGI